MTSISNSHAVSLSHHGLIIVKGPDAKKFLQGQITSDIEQLSITDHKSRSILGAHCTHKGRMLFSFRACALEGDTIALSIYEPLVENALKQLKKYSIFSKVELANASNDYQMIGIFDLDELPSDFEYTDLSVGEANHYQGSVLIKISNERYELWIPKANANKLLFEEDTLLDSNYWVANDIKEGIGEVRTETVEEFIPQMLNFQLIGNGISFNKGCYTGQEVVARMEYLGKLKRYMQRFIINDNSSDIITPNPGTPLYTKDKKQSVGNVVVAISLNGVTELLAVITEEAVTSGEIYTDSTLQQKIQLLPLPYAIPKE